MKKKTFSILCVWILLITSVVSLNGCSEGMTAENYASEVVSLYSDYSEKFDEITEALSAGRRVTAVSLCDEALEIIDKINSIEPPIAFKDEHEAISECCKKEKEKLELEKEYLEISKDEDSLSDDQLRRISEITEQLSVLSLQSDRFYNTVEAIAGKTLSTRSADERDGNMVGWQ